MKTPLLSILLPARNEFPNIVHTIYSILHCLEADGFDTLHDVEILVSNNVSNDEKWPQKATGGTTDFLSARGIYWTGILKYIYDPMAGNHQTTNKLANLARGKYVFRSDAHMAYAPGFFKRFIQTVDETQAVTHTGIHWMGTYPTEKRTLGIGYTWKLGEKISATWNNYHLSNEWFYVPTQGHAGVGMLRETYKKIRGYNPLLKAYGGGEPYFDGKAWMLGIPVVAEPRCISYHLSAGRGYSYHADDFMYNTFLAGFSLGADMWVERMKINSLRTGRKEVVEKLYDRAWDNCQEDRAWINKRKRLTFNQMMVERPWEQLNKEKLGVGGANLLIYHPTMLELIANSPQALEAYKNSKYQQELDLFIQQNLWDYVYHNDQYERREGKIYKRTSGSKEMEKESEPLVVYR